MRCGKIEASSFYLYAARHEHWYCKYLHGGDKLEIGLTGEALKWRQKRDKPVVFVGGVVSRPYSKRKYRCGNNIQTARRSASRLKADGVAIIAPRGVREPASLANQGRGSGHGGKIFLPKWAAFKNNLRRGAHGRARKRGTVCE